ncbi:MAG: hypothetical protein KBT46_07890 [Ruminococcus sp.]|nr:hypothetical protein [Candidatus Copronaster equi]
MTPACKLCAHGIISPDSDNVLCVKTGIRQLDSSCKSFRYDPLKRIPLKPNKANDFTEEDFQL